MIEDESYDWTVSRYIHLNPVHAALVARPEQWRWPGDPGHVAPGLRRVWVRYETLLSAWRGDWGGKDKDAVSAYRGYVEAGLSEPPTSPFRETFGGWVLGSSRFVERLRRWVGGVSSDPPLRDVAVLAEVLADQRVAARLAVAAAARRVPIDRSGSAPRGP